MLKQCIETAATVTFALAAGPPCLQAGGCGWKGCCAWALRLGYRSLRDLGYVLECAGRLRHLSCYMIHVAVVCVRVDIPYNQHHQDCCIICRCTQDLPFLRLASGVWVAAACLRTCAGPGVATGVDGGGCGYGCLAPCLLALPQTVHQQAWHSPHVLTIYACWRDPSVLGVPASEGLGIWYGG